MTQDLWEGQEINQGAQEKYRRPRVPACPQGLACSPRTPSPAPAGAGHGTAEPSPRPGPAGLSSAGLGQVRWLWRSQFQLLFSGG